MLVKLYRIDHWGKPVETRPELGESLPRHADMLRYDLAFCHPEEPSLVIFPVFRGKDGRTTNKITHGRWDSFSMKVIDQGEVYLEGLNAWITYRHVLPTYGKLEPQTMGEFLAKSDQKFKIVGWR